ncbi:unnamed protein product [Dicrocoelium dendriticum]|nr:unnamed protein product [Dicrocoelium dendriticum]
MMNESWRSAFAVQSAVDEKPVSIEEGQDYGLIAPLSGADVGDAMRSAEDAAPGPGIEEEHCEAENRKRREIDVDWQRLGSQMLWVGHPRRFWTTSEEGSSLKGLKMGFSLSPETYLHIP